MDTSEGHEQVRNLVAATVTTTITSCSEIPSTEDEQDPGEVVVRAPGWESALVWGGYTVRGVKLFDQFELQSSNAGAGARVHNLTLCQRNQAQATAVYCTWGTPLLTHCRIEGTVHVAGRGAAPTVRHCSIEGSRGAGLRVVDHAGGRYEHLAPCFGGFTGKMLAIEWLGHVVKRVAAEGGDEADARCRNAPECD